MKKLILLIKFIFYELITPLNYILSFIVGAIINIIISKNPFANLTPFIVPVFVQSISKGTVHFKNRDRDTLLSLPRERDDPAFLINLKGDIIASIGKTEEIFKKFKIKNLNDFLILNENFAEVKDEEVYSEILHKWFSVKLKKDQDKYLVWLTDITKRVSLDMKLEKQSLFSNEIMNSLDDLVYRNDIYERLAELILTEDFEGLLITRLNEDTLEGNAYKIVNDKFEKSDVIEIDKDSSAPITLSRHKNKIVTDSIENYNSREEFERVNPFHKDIIKFMKHDIKNFINYHKGDISIIAFNKKGNITPFDLRAMESVVDSTRVISSLLDLAKYNDMRFLESMDGLCAAAEFSDEITGKHIYRVNVFSELIARELNLDSKTCIWLGQVAAIHDIGKVAMPEIIKIERLYTDDERIKMQTHTVIGVQILDKMIQRSTRTDERLYLARKIVLNHHQEWCGEGYPGLLDKDYNQVDTLSSDPAYYRSLKPLKGDEIPVEALIVSLADRYDALRSKRHYKDGFSHEKTVEILKNDDRTGRTGEDYFGPDVFNAFLNIHKKMEDIYQKMSE